MKKIIILLFILFLIPMAINAQETNGSSDVMENPPADEIREAVKEKVKERIQNVSVRKVGLVGTIERINESTVELQNEKNQYVVKTNKDTKYKKVRGSKTIKREDLELNEYAIVMGDLNTEDESVLAKLIQLIKEPEVTVRKTVYGMISDFGKNSLILKDENGNEWTMNLSSSTDYLEKNENAELEKIKFSMLEKGDVIIVGGEPDEKLATTLDVLLVLRLPKTDSRSTTDGAPTKEAGESAKTQ